MGTSLVGPVAKIFSQAGAQVQTLVRELDPTYHNLKIPHATAKIKGAM